MRAGDEVRGVWVMREEGKGMEGVGRRTGRLCGIYARYVIGK